MKAYYINLESAHERKTLMEQQINTSNLLFDIHKFSAILGSQRPGKNEMLSNGQWGCWLSHMQVIESSTEINDNLLIIEDDEYFNEMLNHAELIQNQIKEIDWDIIYLDLTIVESEDYLFLSRELKKILVENSSPKIIKLPNTFTAYGTHGYIVNNSRKSKVLEILKSNSMLGLPIDNIFCAASQESRLNSYVLLPLILCPGSETKKSQINSVSHPLENNWIEYRELLSIYRIRNESDRYLNGNEIENTTLKIVNSRLNFSALEKFLPLQNITKNLLD
jgi:GR25 family glycosyltransferase involved in LPS biosynthesis